LVVAYYRIASHYHVSGHLKAEVYRVAGGWGYRVIAGDRIYIDQPFIPGMQGKKPFPDSKSALKAANTVKSKLIHHKRPALTREDLIKAGIDSLGNSD
jgi:hypothetical protein